jgi:microcystin-dependent protein
MATDATGTTTPLGIPTYNTAGDPPSGKGFNATMQVIDSLLAARAPLASPVFTGDPKAPTPATNDNDQSIATSAFVQAVVAAATAALIPSGTVVQTAATAAPSGWLLADGSAVSRTTYSALFAAIGTTHGAGDGSTTFNLPDTKGRVLVHPNGATFGAIGSKGGEETHALSVAELAVHDHGSTSSVSAGTPAGTLNSVSAGTPAGTLSSDSAGTPSGSITVNAGGSHSHNISVLESGGGATNDYGMPSVTGVFNSAGLGTDTAAAHTHTGSFSGSALAGHSHTFTGSAMAGHTHTFTGSALASHSHTTASAGSGTAHNNIQPYIVLNHIIKV